MLSAEYAEILLLGAKPEEGALRSVISVGDERLLEPDVMSALAIDAVHETSEHDRAVLLARGRQPHPLDGYLAERGLRDALLTSLRRDGAAFALLVVGNRAGEVSTFKGDDRSSLKPLPGTQGCCSRTTRSKSSSDTSLPRRVDRVAQPFAFHRANH
jgi:hypothetical protein